MRIVYARCCGLDVHKKSITACVLLRDTAGATQQEIRRFGTMTRDLLELMDWLHGLLGHTIERGALDPFRTLSIAVPRPERPPNNRLNRNIVFKE